MTAQDIKLLSTEDLINELCDRHDAMVFSGIRFPDLKKPDYVCVRRWKGMLFLCHGLLNNLISLISLQILKNEAEFTGGGL